MMRRLATFTKWEEESRVSKQQASLVSRDGRDHEGFSFCDVRLIGGVEGIDFREMDSSNRCCGFGGTFSVKFAGVSAAIGEDKVGWIRQSGAKYVISNDVSCLMHIDGLLKRAQVPVGTMHLAELLAKFDD